MHQALPCLEKHQCNWEDRTCMGTAWLDQAVALLLSFALLPLICCSSHATAGLPCAPNYQGPKNQRSVQGLRAACSTETA